MITHHTKIPDNSARKLESRASDEPVALDPLLRG
jgi:hypothetical protein